MLLLLLGRGPAWANPEAAWPADLVITFSGKGLESGQVLDIKVVNGSDRQQRLTLPPYTVLCPSDPAYSPILLESTGAWDMLPKGQATFRVSGYALRHDRAMPAKGQALRYLPSFTGDGHDRSRRALQVGLEVERQEGFHSTLLPAAKHRLLVLQRLIWAAGGEEANPASPEQLEADLFASFARRGKPPSEKAMKALTASVWKDVSRCLERLRSEKSGGGIERSR
jgi:hypothetical protein